MADGDFVAGLDHVQLAMPAGGESVARAFYGGLLKLREIGKPELLAARGGCWFETGPQQLHLGVEADFRPARKAHPALTVNDLDRLAERLRTAGAPVTFDDDWPGHRRFFTEDPFGNRIECIEAN